MSANLVRPEGIWSRERQLTRRGVLWLGLKCDVRCKMCYDELVSTREKAWMPYPEVVTALDRFRQVYRNEFVDLMGGEPTLHPNVLDIVAYAASIGLRPTVITHGMHLADLDRARAFADAGIHDFLVSVLGIGETTREIHGRGRDNFARQMAGLDNLRALGVPFRFNCVLIRDNMTQLGQIAQLAADKGASVINFLAFNPYFEWTAQPEIEFQVRHSELGPHLQCALARCEELGVEANVRYMPLCQLPGYESHAYTGFQLPYDPHEWDYRSWYDEGGEVTPQWYLDASRRQQQRHHYTHVPECDSCALRAICDGFHEQYVARWGSDEARPFAGPPITDPRHFIGSQRKLSYMLPDATDVVDVPSADSSGSVRREFDDDGRAGVKRRPTSTY